MRKLVLLVIVLMTVALSIGCQQSRLSEEEVKSIVQEEVTRQLAGELVRDVVGQELSSQVTGGRVRDIIRTEVTSQTATFNDAIRQEVTRQLASVDDIVRQEVTSQLASVDTLTLSELYIKNRDGQNIIMLGASVYGDGGLIIFSRDGKAVVHLVGDDGNGMLYVYNIYGEIVAEVEASSSGDGFLGINDRYGLVTFEAP